MERGTRTFIHALVTAWLRTRTVAVIAWVPPGVADERYRARQPAPPSSRMSDLSRDAQWVRRHLLPWVGRRLRGVSSGDGRTPKDVDLRVVDV